MAGYTWQSANLKMAQHYSSVGLDEIVTRMNNTNMIAAIDAYENVAWFGSAIDARRNSFTNVPYDIMRGETVLADESSVDELDPELDLSYVIDDMFTDLDLHGAAYAYFETNMFGMNGKWRRWLPRSMTPRHNESTGELTHFERRYRGAGKRVELDDPNFVYLWMPSYRWEHLPGVGVGHRGLLAASSIQNKDKFQNAYFENGAIAPTLVRIKGFSTLDDDEQKRTRGIFRQMFGGILNAFKVHPIDGDEVDVVPLMQTLKDMSMQELTQTQREEIATGLGVPQNILLGNAANFATARQDDFNLYDKWVVPQAINVIAAQLNERFFVPRGMKMVYRKQRLDVYQDAMLDKSRALVPWHARGVIDDNEVRPMLGFSERDVEDIPEEDEQEVPARLINPADSDTGDDSGQLEQIDAKAHFIGNEAYVTIALPNHPQLVGIQDKLKESLSYEDGSMTGNWQEPDTFHITLVYCYDIDNAALDGTSRTFQIDGFEGFDMRVMGLSMFNNPSGGALHLMVEHSAALDALQKRVWAEFSGCNTSEYSKPHQWQPHITMAYLPSGIPMPKIDLMPFSIKVDAIQFMRDGYLVFQEIVANESVLDAIFDEETKQALDDLDKWERLALKRYKEGTPEKASEFSSDFIAPVQHGALVGMLSSTDDVEHVKALFAEAKLSAGEWVNYG